jgi:ABC-type lipoprotein release transport system permease subunit
VTIHSEVSPTDWVTLLVVAGLLLSVATLASIIPAQSTTRLDPVLALRADG